MELYISIAVGVLIGIYITYTHFRILVLDKKIDATIDTIPDAESLAKEILNLKIPISDLPQETVNKIKEEQSKSKDNTYFG